MQLAFSSNAYLRYTIEETIRRVAGLGYRGIELLADVPHAWPAGLLPEQVDAIRRALDDAGLAISGMSPDGKLVEIIELPDHPWFLACQFHPEFQSTPFEPHPLFRSFVGAAVRRHAGGSAGTRDKLPTQGRLTQR